MGDVSGEVIHRWESLLGAADAEAMPHTGTTMHVTAGDGSRYVLKRIDGLNDLGERRYRLASEYRVLLHLWKSGLPVALPVPTDQGQLFAAGGPDDPIYTLTPLHPADEGDGSALHPPDVYTNIGAAIGRLHAALRSYPHDFPSWTIDLIPRTFDEAIRDVTAGLATPELRRLLTVVDRRRDAMVDSMADLPSQRIHGDCHGGNILVHRGDVSGLVDLDHLPIGPRIYDLAYFIANQTALPGRQQLVDLTGPLLRAVRNLVAGYDSTNELSSQERASLVGVALTVQLQLIGWHLSQPGLSGSQLHLNGLHWLNEHYEALIPG